MSQSSSFHTITEIPPQENHPNAYEIDRNARYDRGIRLWGSHGQRSLERARICLLTCSATGAEALKNMVLGGINSFTIFDDKIVDQSDLGNNFMVKPDSEGQSRAQVVTGECPILI